MGTTISEVVGEQVTDPRQRRGRLAVVLLLVVAGLAAVMVIGRAISGTSQVPTSWADATAQVGGDQFTIEYDGFTYGSDLRGMAWIDPNGTWHDQDVPSCLRVDVGTSVLLRFQAREVTVDGRTWRPIVAIDCR